MLLLRVKSNEQYFSLPLIFTLSVYILASNIVLPCPHIRLLLSNRLFRHMRHFVSTADVCLARISDNVRIFIDNDVFYRPDAQTIVITRIVRKRIDDLIGIAFRNRFVFAKFVCIRRQHRRTQFYRSARITDIVGFRIHVIFILRRRMIIIGYTVNSASRQHQHYCRRDYHNCKKLFH